MNKTNAADLSSAVFIRKFHQCYSDEKNTKFIAVPQISSETRKQ